MPVNAVEELNERLGAPAGDLDAELEQLTAMQEGPQEAASAFPTAFTTSIGCCE